METWKLIAAVPPLIVWLCIYAYLRRVENRLKEAETLADSISRK